MNEQISQANEYAAAFEQFITAHPVVTLLILATVCSWTVTAAFKPFLRWLLPDNIQDACIRMFDCLAAGAIVLKMWPGDHAIVWAIFIGSASPIFYYIAAELLCWWKPGLRKYLTLRELTAGDDSPPQVPDPPGDTQ